MEKSVSISEMTVDVATNNAIMFKPVGPDVKVPMYFRHGKDVYTLLSKDPDGRACYRLR